MVKRRSSSSFRASRQRYGLPRALSCSHLVLIWWKKIIEELDWTQRVGICSRCRYRQSGGWQFE
eukprot:scaffold264290_cov19-Tisochrysis_lutea.AAC.1